MLRRFIKVRTGLFTRVVDDLPVPTTRVDSGFRPVAPQGTTLVETLLAGPAGHGGYRPIVCAPGESYLVRDELATPTVAGIAAAAGAVASERTPVLAFAPLADIHIVDHQPPARGGVRG